MLMGMRVFEMERDIEILESELPDVDRVRSVDTKAGQGEGGEATGYRSSLLWK